MLTITAFKTKDGKIFANYEEAEKHEHDMEFDKWYINNYCNSNMLCKVSLEHIKKWLTENKETIFKFLTNEGEIKC